MPRIRQFFRDLLSPFYAIDYAFLARYLTTAESDYFCRLRKAEMLHAVTVAKRTLLLLPAALAPSERTAVAKAALLHDVGKYHHAMGPLMKTALVLFGSRLAARSRKITPYSALDIYLNHARYSATVTRELDSFREYPYLYDLIRFHHEPKEFLSRYGPPEEAVFRAYKQADDAS